MKIVAFAASNSSKSINKQLVTYAASLVDSAEVEILNISDFELPLFGIDREVELGQPELAKKFLEKLRGADAIIISFAEHNLSYSAAYKNLFDWCSRIETKVYNDKPLLLLSASIGQHGGQTVLGTALSTIPLFGGVIKASLSIPNFNSNFDSNVGQLVDKELIRKLKKALNTLLN
ncbi:MAG: NADPH-dependent FMN reductase [Gammaproteobacteria bacterium]|nr:NADPH-dependent FMN reductase [Gammaproteobacteria bacterium]|tara:strand:- start:78 stop:605 length:528 start_codon:yes stop_codon:yes gene_type:complete